MFFSLSNFLILSGAILIVIGLFFNFFQKNWPLLPGDILIQKDNLTFYFPLVTSIILSIILTFFLNLFK